MEIFPGLNDIEISNHWYGFVTFPVDQIPKLVMHEGIIYAAGYCGSGQFGQDGLVKKLQKLFLILNKKVLSTIFHLGKFLFTTDIRGLCL